MAIYDLKEIHHWDRFYRANFINSLSGFKSASLIGTVNADGCHNLAIFSNIVHLGADPALIGFVNRPKAAAPHTIANIEATGVYTINAIPASMVQQAHQTSAKYADGVSEFEQVGLTPEINTLTKAPFVLESPVKYAIELKEIISITHNQTFLVIGALTGAIVPSELVAADGFIELDKAACIASLGIDGYYSTTAIARFPYAKP
jgi:flavin reductase (DIM6/NTAB) family NADH-FMN oxidoreductase RutF